MRKIIIFDFDGTIADSKKLYIDTIHHSLLEHSFLVRNQQISEHPKNAKHFFGYPKSRVTKALGPKLEMTLKNLDKFSPELMKKLKMQINSDITKKAKSLKMCPYARETLKKLKQKGWKIMLLTNSAGKFISAFLKHHKVEKYFDRLFYAENFSSKESAIRQITRQYKVKVSDVIYVADKLSDVKIAKNVGCRIIVPSACSWDKKKFRHEKYVISNLSQLTDKSL
jgi:phosphoglycolate phosphatase